MLVTELRKVSLHFRYPPTLQSGGRHTTSDHPSESWMHRSQVETFLKASIELHHLPGINPHIQAEIDEKRKRGIKVDRDSKTASLWFVKSHWFQADGNGKPDEWAIWHTTPGLAFYNASGERLQRGSSESYTNQNGARVLKLYGSERIWAHPELLAEESEAQVRQEERENAVEEANGW